MRGGNVLRPRVMRLPDPSPRRGAGSARRGRVGGIGAGLSGAWERGGKRVVALAVAEPLPQRMELEDAAAPFGRRTSDVRTIVRRRTHRSRPEHASQASARRRSRIVPSRCVVRACVSYCFSRMRA
jgi:hypothetical protein